ncbi:MAG: 4-carboxymuconolactone decarboxylase [Steroidobacteraceae bacterium]
MSKETDRRERGRRVREAVLGSAHVARAAKNRTPFNAEFQDFLIEYSWGEIWSRAGLDHRQRSMITIAMLVAMGKTDELKLHLRATRNTGVTRDEVKEIIMHATIYAGVPAAFGAFQIAAEIFAAMDAEPAHPT